MATEWVLLSIYVGGALGISFVCSILEATVLSVRVTDLQSRADQGKKGVLALLDLKQNRIDDAIGAILTLNTVAHTIGASLAGAQAAIVFGDVWLGAFSGVLTLLVLVFTEIIPKTLGTRFSSQLAGIVGIVTMLLVKGLKPVLAAVRVVTRVIAAKHDPEPVSRSEIYAFITMAKVDGSLDENEAKVIHNVITLGQKPVSEVMTPRTVVAMLPAQMPTPDILDQGQAIVYSRIPLYGEDHDHITGYILQREVLMALARSAAPKGEACFPSLDSYARPAWFIPKTVTINETLQQFLTRREQMAIVVDEYGAMAGLVTFEDLVETYLGAENIDESDQVKDLRQLALKLRDQRLLAQRR